MDVRDLAAFYSRFVREQKLGPVDVIGFSLGGYIAAEMAVANAAQFKKMVLVGAAGLKPPTGEIMDLFTLTARSFLNKNVVDTQGDEFKKLFGGEQTPEQYEAWEDARAETARIAWRPYLYTQSMAHLLANVAVVPLAAGQLYQQKIAGSKLVTLDCGHMPEVEKPDDFIREVTNFLG
jgi:pimeloyl-ACP methyl ester carboxylesterase